MKAMKKTLLTFYVGVMLMLPKITWAICIGGGANSNGDWSLSLGTDCNSGPGGISKNAYGLPGGSIFGIVENILYWLLGILSIVSLIGFIISGIMYLTAAGDDDQIKKAKSAMKFSIIGVIVGLSGFVIFQAAQYMLGAQSF